MVTLLVLVALGFVARLRLAALVALALAVLVPSAALAELVGATRAPVPVLLIAGGALRALIEPSRVARDERSSIRSLGLLAAGGLVLVSAGFMVSWGHTPPFLMSLLVCFGLVPLAMQRIEPLRLETWLMWLGGSVGLLAIVERWVLERPIAYAVLGLASPDEKWSVYRSYATLDHPLAAGTFLISVAMLVAARALSERVVGRQSAVVLVLAGAGAFATASRGAILGAIVAATVVGVVLLVRLRLPLVRLILAGTPLVAGALLLSRSTVLTRATSAEGTESSGFRRQLREAGLEVYRDAPWTGHGPNGLAAKLIEAGAPTGLNLENSYVDLLVRIAIPGTALVVALLLLAVLSGARAEQYGVVAALVVFAAAAYTFNLWLGHPQLLVVQGLLIGLALTGRPASRADEVVRDDRPAAAVVA